jgi:predicted TIM-barrel fold metal-dependent hydrolase
MVVGARQFQQENPGASMDPKLRVTFPPDPNPRKPRLVARPGSWDTHFHVYAPHLFPFAEKRRYTPPAAPVEHYLQIAAAIGLERGVIVQPSVHGTDTAVTVDAVAKSGGRLRGMIRSDPKLTADAVARLHAAGVRGLRFPISRDLGDALKEDVFHHNVALMKTVGWVVDMQIDADVMVARADMIRRVPLPVIIDTWGRVDPRDGLDQPAFQVLLELIGEHDVYVKIHGTNRFLDRGVPYADMIRTARALIARAPDHVLWGTDWPHSEVFTPNKMPNDGDLIDMLLDYAPDEQLRKKILVDNPARLFDW